MLLAAAAWQVVPLVVLQGSDPVLCGYSYRHESGIDVRVEKGVRGQDVFTAIDAAGAESVRLTTSSFDSARDLAPVEASEPGRVRLERDLQTSDVGALLFAELGVSGGRLEVGGRGASAQSASTEGRNDVRVLELPAPLPRGVTAMYLNCAGDLIRPE